LYFPGTNCSDCGYNDRDGVTPEGFRQVEQQHRRHQASADFQALYARGIQQRQSMTPPARSYDKEWLILFDATYGPLRPSHQGVVHERDDNVNSLETSPTFDSLSNEPSASRDTAFEDDLRKLRERSRERVATDFSNTRRQIRRPKQKVKRPELTEKIEVPTHTRKKLSCAEYMTYNTHRLTSNLVDDVSLAVIQGFLCDHYDANRCGELSKCIQIRGELAQFLNTLQVAKLQQLGDWDSKLLAQFLVERV